MIWYFAIFFDLVWFDPFLASPIPFMFSSLCHWKIWQGTHLQQSIAVTIYGKPGGTIIPIPVYGVAGYIYVQLFFHHGPWFTVVPVDIHISATFAERGLSQPVKHEVLKRLETLKMWSFTTWRCLSWEGGLNGKVNLSHQIPEPMVNPRWANQ